MGQDGAELSCRGSSVVWRTSSWIMVCHAVLAPAWHRRKDFHCPLAVAAREASQLPSLFYLLGDAQSCRLQEVGFPSGDLRCLFGAESGSQVRPPFTLSGEGLD